MKLAEFVTPKLQRTALATDEEKDPTQVTIHIGGTSEQRKANSRNTAQLLE